MEFNVSHYGEEREIDSTDGEKEIFELIKELTEEPDLEFVRRSSNYVSAVIGPIDVARFKFTSRAKWIQLPYVLGDKVKITEPGDIRELKDDLIKAVETARNING